MPVSAATGSEIEDPSKIPDIDYTPPQPQPESSASGAKVAIGCGIGCLVLLIVGAIGTYLAVSWGLVKLGGLAEELTEGFTEAAPTAFEDPVLDRAKGQAAVAKFDAFRVAMTSGKDAEPLILSADEINYLICHHSSMEGLEEHARVAIDEDRITASISLPLKALGKLPGTSDRYLNCEATIRMEVNQGVLEVYLIELVYGYEEDGTKKTVPEIYMEEIRNENLMKDARNKKDLKETFGALESFKVEDGKVWMIPKKPEDRPQPGVAP